MIFVVVFVILQAKLMQPKKWKVPFEPKQPLLLLQLCRDNFLKVFPSIKSFPKLANKELQAVN